MNMKCYKLAVESVFGKKSQDSAESSSLSHRYLFTALSKRPTPKVKSYHLLSPSLSDLLKDDMSFMDILMHLNECLLCVNVSEKGN